MSSTCRASDSDSDAPASDAPSGYTPATGRCSGIQRNLPRRAAAVIGAVCTRDDGSDLLATYERWRTNRNPTDASRLSARGVVLDLEPKLH